MAEGEEPDLTAPPPAWKEIEKYDLDKPFWELVHSTFAYSAESPTLHNLLIRLMASDYILKLPPAKKTGIKAP